MNGTLTPRLYISNEGRGRETGLALVSLSNAVGSTGVQADAEDSSPDTAGGRSLSQVRLRRDGGSEVVDRGGRAKDSRGEESEAALTSGSWLCTVVVGDDRDCGGRNCRSRFDGRGGGGGGGHFHGRTLLWGAVAGLDRCAAVTPLRRLPTSPFVERFCLVALSRAIMAAAWRISPNGATGLLLEKPTVGLVCAICTCWVYINGFFGEPIPFLDSEHPIWY